MYGLDTSDGYSKDFEADSNEDALVEAARIMCEEFGSPQGTRYEVWDLESDTLVAAKEVTR